MGKEDSLSCHCTVRLYNEMHPLHFTILHGAEFNTKGLNVFLTVPSSGTRTGVLIQYKHGFEPE